MKKEVFKIDQNGYIMERYVAEFDNEDNLVVELEENIITIPPPSFYKPKWNGTEWIEEGTQPVQQPKKPTEIDYLLDLDFRLSMLELGL